MNSDEFCISLRTLGLTQRAASVLLGKSLPTISGWATGKHPIPDDVAAKLALPDAVPVDEIADPIVARFVAQPTGRIDQHAPGHIANSTPVPHVGDIVRIAPPHGGPWMQVRWIENGLYNCWFEQAGQRYADDYSLERLETLYADRKAAGVVWPPKGNIEALPISKFSAKPYVAQKRQDGTYRFGVLRPD